MSDDQGNSEKGQGFGKSVARIGLTGVFLFFVMHSCSSFVHTQEEGKEFLEDKGYTNVTGGEGIDIMFNGLCGKGTAQREYVVYDPKKGKKKNTSVCFSSIFGKYEPVL